MYSETKKGGLLHFENGFLYLSKEFFGFQPIEHATDKLKCLGVISGQRIQISLAPLLL